MTKYSKKRELILKAVKDNPVHPTADFIYQKLNAEIPGLSLGTVYRNLNILAEDKLIHKLKMAAGPDRFDGDLHPHYHLICKSCGKLVDIDTRAMDGIEKKVSQDTGHQIEGYDIVFEGVCQECLAKQQVQKKQRQEKARVVKMDSEICAG